MKPWTVMLGVGAACAACCAIPLLGVAGGLAAFGSALWACADEFAPVAIALGLVATALAGLWFWQGRRARRKAACGCAGTCSTETANANP